MGKGFSVGSRGALVLHLKPSIEILKIEYILRINLINRTFATENEQ